jgi:NTE family protein
MRLIDRVLNRKPKIGLALSGGATLGAAHIGVLQVLEREGIRPDVVAGTSAGAMVGALYCAGFALDELAQLFTTMKWPTLIKLAITKPQALFDIQPMDDVLKQKIGDINFEDLKIPFAAISCDLRTGKRVVMDHGPLAIAVRASASIPGLFLPVEHNDCMLVDGGLVDNLPVEQVRAMGAGFVIASDVSNRGETSEKPTTIFEILLTTFNIMQDRGALPNSDECDCYIRPMVTQYPCWGFSDTEKILEEGKKAAELALPKLSRFVHHSSEK